MSKKATIRALGNQLLELEREADHWYRMAKEAGRVANEERAKRHAMEISGNDEIIEAQHRALEEWRDWAATVTGVFNKTDSQFRDRITLNSLEAGTK